MKDKNIFIAVEGPIGAGKTTLANLLNEHFGYTLLREIVEENPFLAKLSMNMLYKQKHFFYSIELSN